MPKMLHTLQLKYDTQIVVVISIVSKCVLFLKFKGFWIFFESAHSSCLLNLLKQPSSTISFFTKQFRLKRLFTNFAQISSKNFWENKFIKFIGENVHISIILFGYHKVLYKQSYVSTIIIIIKNSRPEIGPADFLRVFLLICKLWLEGSTTVGETFFDIIIPVFNKNDLQ